jgi:hypothetical protein
VHGLPALLVLLTATPAASPPAAGAATRFEILDPGDYLERDLAKLPAARDLAWMVLCPTPAGAELRQVTIEVRPFRSGAVNDPPGKTSGRTVVAPGCAEPIALVRGPGLEPGKVPTVAHEEGKIAFAGSDYVVKRDKPEPEPEDPCGKKRVHLVLTAGESRHVLAEADFCTLFGIRWSGDLDGDGKLDLVVVDNLDSGSNQLRLFLSKVAPAKAPMKQVATSMHKS